MFRPPSTFPSNAQAQHSTHPSGEVFGSSGNDHQMALLAFSHTPSEDQLYRAMLLEVMRAGRFEAAFSVRELVGLAGINSPSTVRRAINGLLRKLSIESAPSVGMSAREGNFYRIFKPEEIFGRRRARGILPYPKEIEIYQSSMGLERAIERIARNGNLSRREAQVALACSEGITNIEIGRRLSIAEQTVKFHLRNIFTKFGVKRRTELISRLLVREGYPLFNKESVVGE